MTLALCLMPGCYTGLDGTASGIPPRADSGADGDDDDAQDDGDDDGAEPSDQRRDPTIGDYHAAIGVRRLSKFEYGNTVRDLLGVEGAEAPLAGDQKIAFLSNNTHAQQVGLGDLEGFSRAAEDASEIALSTLALPPGCTLDTLDSTCVGSVLDDLLPRAFRQPATAADTERYVALFDERMTAGDPTREAFRLVLEAVLMSPKFLYRSELGGGQDGDPLDSFEVASRLSYLLWGSMPDDELFDLAKANMLDDPAVIEEQAARMLLDDKAEAGTVRFVAEWLGFDEVELAKKADEVTEGLPETLQQDLEQEAHRFVAHALLGPSPSLHTLLSSTTSFANDTVAQLYGLEGSFGETFVEVELDAAERRGALTLPVVVASHAKESGFSAVQMGRFIRERVLCQETPDPPPDVDPSIDDSGAVEGESYRELLSRITSEPACSGCHTALNPPGFAFLPYDPIGRFLEVDSLGRPFETDGILNNVDGTQTEFADAVEMANILADSNEVRACFTRKYIEYAFGRTLAEADVELYHQLADHMDDTRGDFAGFVATLVLSTEFSRVGPFE